jgi:hypothetical protein
MGLQHDLALVDDGRTRLESDRPTPTLGAELGLLVRKVTSGHSCIAKWSSWLLGTEIQVSRMSGTWLRTHADDWNKHPLDL